MKKLLLRFRPGVTTLATGMLLGSAVQTENLDIWAAVLAVLQFLICGFTMVSNDLVDRDADVLKGKRMTDVEFSVLGRQANVGWTSIVVVLIGYWWLRFNSNEMFVASWQVGVLLLQVGVGIWFYTMLRPRWPHNNLLVAVTAATPTLLFVPEAGQNAWLLIGAFFSVACYILMREMVKDIQDYESDKVTNKQTVMTLYGFDRSWLVVFRLACFAPLPVTVGSIIAGDPNRTLLYPLFLLWGWSWREAISYRWGVRWMDRRVLYFKNQLDIWLMMCVLVWIFRLPDFFSSLGGFLILMFGVYVPLMAVLIHTKVVYKKWG